VNSEALHWQPGRTQADSAAMVAENRNQRGPYFTAFSLHISDMCVKIDKIGARPGWV
jgi:hypothetical protein